MDWSMDTFHRRSYLRALGSLTLLNTLSLTLLAALEGVGWRERLFEGSYVLSLASTAVSRRAATLKVELNV